MNFDPLWGNISSSNASSGGKVTLLSGVTSQAVGGVIKAQAPVSFQFWITGTSGTCTATVKLWASNDDQCQSNQSIAAKTLLATTTQLSGTGVGNGTAVATDAWVCAVPYSYFWAEVTAISGTGTAVYSKAFY